MKRQRTYILTGLFLPLFLISITGISLERHTCDTCDTVSYSLLGQSSCCEETASCNVSQQTSCCAPSDHQVPLSCDSACCSVESLVFWMDDVYLPVKQKTDGNVQPIIMAASITIIENPGTETIHSRFYSSNAPPAHRSGISFLIFTSQLKIDCQA